MLRVGLIGFGFTAQTFHAPVIRAVEGMKLCLILERSGALAAQRYPEVRIARTLDEFLAVDEIELCVIATPNASHFDLARQCLLAGRHVVVDKPFTITSLEAEELMRVAHETKRVLSVYHNRRWDGDFQTAGKLLKSGDLGRVVAYESQYDRFRPQPKPNAWREKNEPGSGILYDLGPHLIDQAFALFGPPEAIMADVRIERDTAQVDDAFDIAMHYPRLRVTLSSTMLACSPRPRFRIFGTRGSFVKESFDPQEDMLRRGETPGRVGWGADPEERWGTMHFLDGVESTTKKVKTEAGDYCGFYANVRDAIVKGDRLTVTARDGWNVIRAIELARECSRGRRAIAW
ncbi:MAG: oxidoreductase [Candidatus Acidiferrales bacterium]